MVEVEIGDMGVFGRPQKPVRSERGGEPPTDSSGFALRPCCVCGDRVTDMCPDCETYLCCKIPCERDHLNRCPPIKRDALSGCAE